MKKILVFILSLILSLGTVSFAENQPENTDAPENISEYSTIDEETENKTDDKYLKHICEFNKDIPAEKIYVQSDTLTFYLDTDKSTQNLNALAMPLNTTHKKMTYKSSDLSLAIVDENGNVTVSNKAGECDITINSGSVVKDVHINVIRGVSGINLSRNDMLFYVDRPVTATLKADIYPVDATNKNVKWKSADTSIATVDENGVVTPCGVGQVNITAVTEDGGFTATCIVYVKVYDVAVRGVFITNAIEAMRIGTDYKLEHTIYPTDARNKDVKWESSDESIVTVDKNGSLKGIAEGMAYITVSSSNGIEDYFTISVVPDDGTEFHYNIISQSVEERIKQLSVGATYDSISSSLQSAIKAQMAQSPVVFTTNATAATQADVEKYINPANYNSGYDKYQFLDLSSPNNISASVLDSYLNGKGVLSGKGEIFLNAAHNYGISEIYLVVHACLESGSGSSKLATGVDYNGTTVYNMFGIGAYDADPINEGAKYAYEHGWTTIDAAIDGGASWISTNYINNPDYNQNTLYKMRWNPHKPGIHQYATDVSWAVKQAKTIGRMFEAFPNASLIFDVPVYSGESDPVLTY